MDEEPIWYPYEGGATLGQEGIAFGVIRRDEEFGVPGAADADDEDTPGPDARVTLEAGENGEWFVSATLYGWMAHTVTLASEEKASALYERLKGEMEALAALLPYEDDADAEDKMRKLTDAVQELTERLENV